MKTEYHPDPEINEEVAQEATESEIADLKAGFPARKWRCSKCHTAHSRGFFPELGSHRCLACGYVGSGGVLEGAVKSKPLSDAERLDHLSRLAGHFADDSFQTITITISGDDATRSWSIYAGKKQVGYGSTIRDAIDKAISGMEREGV